MIWLIGWKMVSRRRRGVAFFFFSSRRRHTRLQGDWSSDVCSSDLSAAFSPGGGGKREADRIRRDAGVRRADAPQPQSRPLDGEKSGGIPPLARGDRKSVV